MNIVYTSESKIYKLENGSKSEIPCGKILKYKEALESIRRRTEWKTSGQGAMFTGAAMAEADSEEQTASFITGIADNGGKLIYGVFIDKSCSLYQRSFDKDDENEGLILSGNDLCFGSFDCLDGKMAVSLGPNPHEMHIAVMEPPASYYTEYTDGDTVEEFPCWSRAHKNRIYFSTSGNARDEYGRVGAVSNKSGAYIDIEKNEMTDFLSDEKYDFLKIKDDKAGNIYYIRQIAGGEKPDSSAKISDVLFFPFRLIKGLFGWLNFMCTIWGGEPLKSGSGGLPSNIKAKQREQKDIIIEGNVINAQKLAKEADMNDSAASGLMPLSRVLIKREADGEETVIKKGVLDYSLCPDGKILCSDGKKITLIDGERETFVAKAYLAMNMVIIPEE